MRTPTSPGATSSTELEDYLEELTRPPVADYMRGNLWPNTPDILPEVLQHGGPAGVPDLRLALAATLSSSYGIYCGYELCEGTRGCTGKEEYLDSEKYQLKAWDLDRPGQHPRLHRPAQRHRASEHPALPALPEPRASTPRTTSGCSSTASARRTARARCWWR